jgi:hypothetical protein
MMVIYVDSKKNAFGTIISFVPKRIFACWRDSFTPWSRIELGMGRSRRR